MEKTEQKLTLTCTPDQAKLMKDLFKDEKRQLLKELKFHDLTYEGTIQRNRELLDINELLLKIDILLKNQ